MRWFQSDVADESEHGSAGGGPGVSPGKRTLTMGLAPRPAAALDAVRSDGGGRLPHHDAVQRAFGGHDLGEVRAHVGGAAERAAGLLGASAFATGTHVGFAQPPTLHTVAHEAAHVVQQRGLGASLQGLGGADDEHERHADAVADVVVGGGSAEALLDRYAPRGAVGSGGGALQLMRIAAKDLKYRGQDGSQQLQTLLAKLGDPYDTKDLTPDESQLLLDALVAGTYGLKHARNNASLKGVLRKRLNAEPSKDMVRLAKQKEARGKVQSDKRAKPSQPESEEEAAESSSEEEEKKEKATPTKRGRPKKEPAKDSDSEAEASASDSEKKVVKKPKAPAKKTEESEEEESGAEEEPAEEPAAEEPAAEDEASGSDEDDLTMHMRRSPTPDRMGTSSSGKEPAVTSAIKAIHTEQKRGVVDDGEELVGVSRLAALVAGVTGNICVAVALDDGVLYVAANTDGPAFASNLRALVNVLTEEDDEHVNAAARRPINELAKEDTSIDVDYDDTGKRGTESKKEGTLLDGVAKAHHSDHGGFAKAPSRDELREARVPAGRKLRTAAAYFRENVESIVVHASQDKDKHAEMRLLDGAHDAYQAGVEVADLKIGISKLCCALCQLGIAVFRSLHGDDSVQVQGAHCRVYGKWTPPRFVLNNLDTFVELATAAGSHVLDDVDLGEYKPTIYKMMKQYGEKSKRDGVDTNYYSDGEGKNDKADGAASDEEDAEEAEEDAEDSGEETKTKAKPKGTTKAKPKGKKGKGQ